MAFAFLCVAHSRSTRFRKEARLVTRPHETRPFIDTDYGSQAPFKSVSISAFAHRETSTRAAEEREIEVRRLHFPLSSIFQNPRIPSISISEEYTNRRSQIF
ncbi:hypothetical protein AAC387_Pa02g4554 [Persea americana]